MIILTAYSLDGKILESDFIESKYIEKKTLGQKVRVYLKDGRTYIGFTNTTFGSKTKQKLVLFLYDIDEPRNKLRSGDLIETFIPLDQITRVESIRFSNPRWGSPLTNHFETVEEWKERMQKYRHVKNDKN